MKKCKVSFYLKGDKKNSQGDVAVYGKIHLDGTLSTFSTGMYINSERWEKTNYLRNPLRIASEISLKNYLDSIEQSIYDKYLILLRTIKSENVTASKLKRFVFIGEETVKKISLVEVINDYTDYFRQQVEKKERSKGSLEKYLRMVEVVKQFIMLKYKKSDIEFDAVNRQFVYDLDYFLRFERVHNGKKGLANNTAVKYMRNISAMLNYAKKRGVINDNPFEIYDGKLADVDTVFLTLDELRSIEKKHFDNRRLDVARDIFLFSCYTSFSPVDVMNLTYDNYIQDEDGDYWIKTNRQKTKVKTSIPVLPSLQKILDKYKKDPECEEFNRLIPNRSNSNMNAYLKEIADLCGIKKNLTWYVGRHTFATTVALANKIPLEVISQIMGHKRVTQTQHYAKLMDGSVKSHMKKIHDKFS
jgi:integrase